MAFLDDLTALVQRLVRPQIDPLASYDATVKAMNDDGTVDVKPDSPRWGPGLSRVPVRHGIPGVTLRAKIGARVRLRFAQGDETQPYVAEWDSATGLESIKIEASVSLILKSPSSIVAEVEGNAKPPARQGDLVKVTGVSGPPGTPIELVGYILDGAKKTKVE